jgi:hypothetical protein
MACRPPSAGWKYRIGVQTTPKSSAERLSDEVLTGTMHLIFESSSASSPAWLSWSTTGWSATTKPTRVPGKIGRRPAIRSARIAASRRAGEKPSAGSSTGLSVTSSSRATPVIPT